MHFWHDPITLIVTYMYAQLWLKIKGVALDILFPPVCLTCGSALDERDKTRQLCEKCFGSILIHNTLLCAECGARLPDNKKTCHARTSYKLAAAAPYDNLVVKRLIHLLKYKCVRAASVPLTHIMLVYIKAAGFNLQKFVIVPLPLHKEREHLRGFNQSELIAEKISAALGLPLVANALVRIKNNPPQAEMKDKKSRLENLAGCFAMSTSGEKNNVLRGAHVLLVDDVHTTGATAAEAVATLKRAGVKITIPLVAARA